MMKIDEFDAELLRQDDDGCLFRIAGGATNGAFDALLATVLERSPVRVLTAANETLRGAVASVHLDEAKRHLEARVRLERTVAPSRRRREAVAA